MKNRHKSHLVFALFLLAGFLAAGSEAFASTFLKLDVAGLTETSESVVQARVVGSESAWNARGSMIFTNVTLDVIRTIHGRSQDRIVVRVPAGNWEAPSTCSVRSPTVPPGTRTTMRSCDLP